MRTERILIKKSHSHYQAIHNLCRMTARISNQGLYYLRQAFFHHDKLHWTEVDKLLKLKHSDLYNSIPNAISQQAIKKLGTEFDAFWKAYRVWKKHPEKFKERPRIPNYKKSKTALQPGQGISVKQGALNFPKKLNLEPLTIHCCIEQKSLAKKSEATVLEVRYVPHGSCYWVELVYNRAETLKPDFKLNPNHVLGIDLGINNLATLVSNQPNFTSVLVNGKPMKSLNQRYNKHKAELQSKGHKRIIAHKSIHRFCSINDFFHKVSHLIVELCIEHDIGRIVIGKNDGWKQQVNIGKANNQQFTSIPHQTLINKIRYKVEAFGIEVVEHEEAHSSKADSLALDPVPAYKKGENNEFSGKRRKRGLYQSSLKKLLNADVNGAINILRKVIGDDFVPGLIDKGAVFAPLRWTPA